MNIQSSEGKIRCHRHLRTDHGVALDDAACTKRRKFVVYNTLGITINLDVMSHAFTYVYFGGAVYLLVWTVYRIHRHREHRKYRELHGVERMRRAEYAAEFGPNAELEPQEILRRARWDEQYGPLMQPLELKNREENRWPIGNALQGLATLVTGLLVATLIWDVRSPVHGGFMPTPYENGMNPPESTASLSSGSQDSVFLLCLILVGSGVAFWGLSKTRIGRYVGGSLILSASLLSGLKILNIEKMISIGEVTGVKVHLPEKIDIGKRPAYTLSVRLPPYQTASASPSSRMICATRTVARALAKNAGLHTVVVITAADRRELRPEVRREFASNWALAQQRGANIAAILARQVPPGAAILVTNAGPTNTSGILDENRLSQDRTPVIQVSGFGAPSKELQSIEEANWNTACSE